MKISEIIEALESEVRYVTAGKTIAPIEDAILREIVTILRNEADRLDQQPAAAEKPAAAPPALSPLPTPSEEAPASPFVASAAPSSPVIGDLSPFLSPSGAPLQSSTPTAAEGDISTSTDQETATSDPEAGQ